MPLKRKSARLSSLPGTPVRISTSVVDDSGPAVAPPSDGGNSRGHGKHGGCRTEEDVNSMSCRSSLNAASECSECSVACRVIGSKVLYLEKSPILYGSFLCESIPILYGSFLGSKVLYLGKVSYTIWVFLM